MGTRLNFRTAYHPQTSGQPERTTQTLGDMFKAYVLNLGGCWETHLLLVEFAYITIVFKKQLAWHHMELFMEENISHLYIGMKLVKENF